MKHDIIRILNEELNRATLMKEQAKKNQDLLKKLAWEEYEALVKNLIKRIQDEG